MVSAYIPQKDTNQPDGVLYFTLTDNEDKILEAPVDQTFFVDDDPKTGFEQLKTELERRYPLIDRIDQKYLPLYKNRFSNSYSYTEVSFKINSDLKLDHSIALNNPQLFADYIKEYGTFNFKNNNYYYYYPFRPINLKRALNKYGIYVRPVKGLLEYNPKMAKKQMDLVSGKSKRQPKNIDLKFYDLTDLRNALSSLLKNNTNLEINYYYNAYRKKTCVCMYIVLFVDICDIFLKPASYRYLKAFETVKIRWMQMKQKQKMQYPKIFRSFMNKEAKIDSPTLELILSSWQLKPKTNPNIFSRTKFEKSKFYHQLNTINNQ